MIWPSRQPFPANRQLYDGRYARLCKLIRLRAPVPVVCGEAFLLLEAAYGSYWRLLLMAFREWREHFWFNRIAGPPARARCRVWCWWNRKTPKDYWELQEIKRERKQPPSERCGAFDDEVRH